MATPQENGSNLKSPSSQVKAISPEQGLRFLIRNPTYPVFGCFEPACFPKFEQIALRVQVPTLNGQYLPNATLLDSTYPAPSLQFLVHPMCSYLAASEPHQAGVSRITPSRPLAACRHGRSTRPRTWATEANLLGGYCIYCPMHISGRPCNASVARLEGFALFLLTTIINRYPSTTKP